MSKRAVCNDFKRPLMDILIVYNKKRKKTGDKIFMAKTRSNTGDNGSRSLDFYVY